MDGIVLVGSGGHAQSVADSIEASKTFQIIGYTNPHETSLHYPYLGTDDVLESLYRKGICFAAIGVGFIGKSEIRDKLYTQIKKIGFHLPPIIDPSAVLSQNCSIGEGTFVGKGACINVNARIGKMCIINTSAIIEHGNVIGDFTHVAVGAALCGDVTVEDHVFIGANATVIQGLTIGSHTIIGAGSTVLHNVTGNTTVYGII